jgi:hypothetical protein
MPCRGGRFAGTCTSQASPQRSSSCTKCQPIVKGVKRHPFGDYCIVITKKRFALSLWCRSGPESDRAANRASGELLGSVGAHMIG